MINECNFKNPCEESYQCMLGIKTDKLHHGLMNVYKCPGEDNCILYQIYKQKQSYTFAWTIDDNNDTEFRRHYDFIKHNLPDGVTYEEYCKHTCEMVDCDGTCEGFYPGIEELKSKHYNEMRKFMKK